MRSYVIFALLLTMFGLFAVVTSIRSLPLHAAPALPVTGEETLPPQGEGDRASDRRDKGASPSVLHEDAPSPLEDPGLSAGGVPLDGLARPDAPPPVDLGGRTGPGSGEVTLPLRIVGHSWPLLAPALVANKGVTPGRGSFFQERGVDVQLSVAPSIGQLAEALARGGAQEGGADVAILPLPLFVAAYEPLRALSPKVFFVVGWSEGEEELRARRPDALLGGLPREGQVSLLTTVGSTAHLFGLFLLDMAGVPPGRVVEVGPGQGEARRETKGITMEAVPFRRHDPASGAPARTPVMTTAHTPRLVSYVAVASQTLIESRPAGLRALCRGWIAGAAELERDVPAGARRVAAAADGLGALELLGHLGRVGHATLKENARLAGLSHRGAVTIEDLFQHTWRLWKEADVTSTSPPHGIVAEEIITALVVSAPPAELTGGEDQGPVTTGRTLLVRRTARRPPDEDSLMTTIGWMAGVFGPLALRVGANERTETPLDDILAKARERFDIPPHRMLKAPDGPNRGGAVIEVLERP